MDYRPGSIVGWDRFAAPTDFALSPLSQALKQPILLGLKRRAIGGNIEVIGTPEQVVEQFIQLKKAGVDGLQLSFFDFQKDLEFFGDRILPLMKQVGLRL